MKSVRIVCFVLLAAGAWPDPARADWLVMPFIALGFAGETTIVDLERAAGNTHLTYGGTVAWLDRGVLGFEADVGFTPGFFERDEGPELITSSQVLTLMGNVVVAMPLSWTAESLRPYVSGGFGALRASTQDSLNVFRVDRTFLAFNAGGGVIGFVTDRTGVRWDVRFFRTVRGKDDEGGVGFGSLRLSFWRASMALVLRY